MKNHFLKVQKEAKNKNKLIEKSAQILLSLDIPHLNKRGIKRIAFQYEMFNQYPPFFLQKNISDKEIFQNSTFLEQKEKKEPFALYVHLPFCVKKCTFCCYFSTTNWSRYEIDNYLSYLEKEILLLLKKDCVRKRMVSSIYWGGGTPTILNQNQINRLAKVLRDNFSIASDAELTCEATPESITPENLSCLLKNGFNRLSIGVQTFDDKLLKSYNRLHTGEEAIESFILSKRLGFSHINIDLMFGLAGQTICSWKETLDITRELKPTNVTFYPFSDSYGKTIMYRNSKSLFPSEEENLLMHIMAIEKFLNAGYIQITPYQFIISWKYPYAHQEHKAKNGEIYALGVTGHSFFHNCDYHNQSSFAKYKSLLEENRLPVERGRYLDKKERMTRFIIYGLQKTSGLNRENGGIDKVAFKEHFGVSIEDAFKEKLEKLKELGLILNSSRCIRLSYKGLLYPVETSLFFYFKKDRKRIAQLFIKIKR